MTTSNRGYIISGTRARSTSASCLSKLETNMSDNTAIMINYRKVDGRALGLFGVKHTCIDAQDARRIGKDDETFSSLERALREASTMFSTLVEEHRAPEYGIRLSFDARNPNGIPQPTLNWFTN